MKLKIWAWLIAVILSLMLFVQNTQVVTLKFLFWHVSMSRIILVIFIWMGFLLGFLIGKRS